MKICKECEIEKQLDDFWNDKGRLDGKVDRCIVCIRIKRGKTESYTKRAEYGLGIDSQRPWRRFKGSFCERCGFIPEDSCQLDVDHIDGNKKNNDICNLQTLCANCHRLKTKINKDYSNNYRPVKDG